MLPWLFWSTSSTKRATPCPWWDASGRVTANLPVIWAAAGPDKRAVAARASRPWVSLIFMISSLETAKLTPPPGRHDDQGREKNDQHQHHQFGGEKGHHATGGLRER